MTSSLDSNDSLERLTELRDTLTFTRLLKDMIKGINEHPDEEVHRARSGRILTTGASVPTELGALPFQCGCVCRPGSSLNPGLLEFYGGFLP